MQRPTIVSVVAAALIAAFIAAATTAAPHGQCHSQSTYLGNNPNDEADSWSHNNHMARCQYGTDAETAARIEHRMARGDRLDRREQQVAQRRKPPNDFDQRTQARAEAKYQKHGVATWEFCRNLEPTRMRDCMRGMISR